MTRDGHSPPVGEMRGPGDTTSRTAIAFVCIAYLLLIAVMLASYHGDASRFIVAGDRFFEPARLAYPVHVEPHSDGYDGQFYYRLAIDPLTTKRTDYGITIDSPVVRSQRIVYPLIAWAMTLGHPAALPYALIVINLLAVAGIAWLGTMLARHHGVPARLGALLAFYPGFVLSVGRDTTEVIAGFFALSALVLASRERWAAAGLVAAVAVLTKETTLFYLAGFGVVAARRFGRERTDVWRVVWMAAPVIAFVGWQLVLRSRWGSLPSGDLGSHDLAAVPLLGYVRYTVGYAREALAGPVRFRILFELVTIPGVAALIAVTAVALVRHPSRPNGFVLPWTLYLLLACFFTGDIWNEAYGFLRVLSDLYLLAVAILIAVRSEAVLRRLCWPVGALWVGAVVYSL